VESGEITVIGGGLAGCEAAWQAAKRGMQVRLFEMRPNQSTGAHLTGDLAELVCSNSLGSNLLDRASGLLKEELRILGSLLLECAEATALPAGTALAVDREAFARLVTERIHNHPRITVIREEVKAIPAGPVIVASGPLTSENLARSIKTLSGEDQLFFFDAIAPIVRLESINMQIAFRQSRYVRDTGEGGDYINCPVDKETYERFVEELCHADRIPMRSFEDEIKNGVKAGAHHFFEGCLPLEIMAERSPRSLAFGPMRPVGITDPRTGRGVYAVVQLRQDNIAGSLYNMVGFQTNLTFGEQKRIFQMIPGLERAEFDRYGQMHRNTFLAAPRLLLPTLQFRDRSDLFFAGQIVGVEGYMGNIATGLLAGVNVTRLMQGRELMTLPQTTMLGALCYYVTHADLADFQPMKANYGILPGLRSIRRVTKSMRSLAHRRKSLEDLSSYLELVRYDEDNAGGAF
jgi:methylenetetrahydrofolate--tRNA-(uracil-5-)-methyltransferase